MRKNSPTRKTGAFGLACDGSLDRREFVRAASRLGASLGLSMGGLAPLLAAAQSRDPLKLGWIRPTTGRLASSFAPLYVGGLIAVEEINAAGGIMGRPIVRIEEDDEAAPAKQPAVAKKVMDANPFAIFGPVGTSQAMASVAMTSPNKVIHTTSANGTDMGDGVKYPYHYQVSYNSQTQAEVIVRHLAENLKLKKIGIIQENTAFGEQGTAASLLLLEKLGIKPVGVEVYPLTAPDLSPYVGNLRKAGAEGLIAWISTIPSASMAFNAMHRQQWYPHIAGHAGLFLESIFDLVPTEAVAKVYATYYKNFTWTATEGIGEPQLAYARKIATYAEARGNEVIVAGQPYYDFLYLLKMVIESEKSFDPDRIKRVLDNLKGHKGIIGTLSFTPTNHTAISAQDVVLASLVSAKDPKAQRVFRERHVV